MDQWLIYGRVTQALLKWVRDYNNYNYSFVKQMWSFCQNLAWWIGSLSVVEQLRFRLEIINKKHFFYYMLVSQEWGTLRKDSLPTCSLWENLKTFWKNLEAAHSTRRCASSLWFPSSINVTSEWTGFCSAFVQSELNVDVIISTHGAFPVRVRYSTVRAIPPLVFYKKGEGG